MVNHLHYESILQGDIQDWFPWLPMDPNYWQATSNAFHLGARELQDLVLSLLLILLEVSSAGCRPRPRNHHSYPTFKPSQVSHLLGKALGVPIDPLEPVRLFDPSKLAEDISRSPLFDKA